MEILYHIINVILGLCILYLIYLLLFVGALTTKSGFENPSSKSVASPKIPSDPLKDEIIVPGEDILHTAKLKATNDKNSKALSYINDYYKINNEYKQILTDKKAREDSAKYKSEESYEPTPPNQMVCKAANSGLPFMGLLARFCTILPNSTKCHNYDDNFNGWCQIDQGNKTEFGVGKPSQLVSGQVSKYNGGCPGGAMGVGGQSRAECAYGSSGNAKLPVNSTQCYLLTANLDNTCMQQPGANKDYTKGITSDYVFGVKQFLGNGKAGCDGGQQRAECGLNYAGGKALKPNSTKCHLWTDDFNGHCRYYAGNGQTPIPSASVPSQDIWGQQNKYGGGCITGQGRAQCAKGYSGGVKLKPFSTQCYLWTDNFGGRCTQNYGAGWALDTRQPGYGKYGGGCMKGQGRGVCVKTSDLPANAELPGAMCGLWDSISDQWCRNDFGNAFNLDKKISGGCIGGQGRGACKKLPINTKKASGCGLWTDVGWGGLPRQNQYCVNDFGPDWKTLGTIQSNCPYGMAASNCQKFK